MSDSLKYTNDELAILEKELKKNPSDFMCYVRLADAQLSLDKKQQAFSTYRAAKVICPNEPAILKIGAKILEALGKKEEAVDCWQKAINLAGSIKYEYEPVVRLSSLLYDSGKKEESLAWLKKLAAFSTENPEIFMKLAQVHLGLGNLSEAQSCLKEYKSKVGATRETFLLLGQAMLARGFYDGAVKNYSDAVKDFPQDPEMHLGLGKAWLGMNEKGIALKEYSEAARLAPENVQNLLELGKLQGDLGLTNDADTTFAKIEKSKQQNGEIFFELAKYFFNRSNDARGLKYLDTARSLSAFHPEILKLSCEIYTKLGKLNEALALYEKALASIGGNSDVCWCYDGIVHIADRLEDYTKKADAQKKLLSLKEPAAESWCDYGETLVKLEKFDDARDAFEKAAELDPTCLRAFQAPEIIQLGKAHAESEKLAKQGEDALEKRFYMTAVSKLEKALELNPDNPKWSKLLAKVYYKIGNFHKASKLLSFVRSYEPANLEISCQLAKCYEMSGDYQMAIELLTAATKTNPSDLKTFLMLLRLKRSQIRRSCITADIMESIAENIGTELDSISKESPVCLLAKGYAYYIFSFNTSFLAEGLNKAESCFKAVIQNFGENPEVCYALALCQRVRGNFPSAIDYMRSYVRLSTKADKTLCLARLLENSKNYDEALSCYRSLREQFPENGYYRRKFVEMTAFLQGETRKNQLNMLISECHRKSMTQPSDIWPIYEMALAQEMASQTENNLSKEWQKRSMISWHKAESHTELNQWVTENLVRCQLKNLSGIEKVKMANSLKKLCEKTIREAPDSAESYLAMARCYLTFNDLTNKDNALNYLMRAWFLDNSIIEISELLAETAKSLGKSDIVDVIGYNVILSEPEISNSVFKFL